LPSNPLDPAWWTSALQAMDLIPIRTASTQAIDVTLVTLGGAPPHR
jgi:hypothetical protein